MLANDGHPRWTSEPMDVHVFLKGTTQGSFQKSIVPIGNAVSDEKILRFSHRNICADG